MQMNYSIGVVVPAYNAQRFIVQALESVAAQTLRPSKIVVVDDGSSDRTFELAQSWASTSPIEIEIHSQVNAGCGAARNTAISHLDVDLLALLDADDIWEPFHLERMHQAFQLTPDLALCFADHQKFDDSGIVMESFLREKLIHSLAYRQLDNGVRILQDNPYSSLLLGNFIPPSTTVISKKIAQQIGFFDAAIRNCEDRDFVLRLSRCGQFAYFAQPHAKYRVHENNITHPKNALPMQRYGVMVLSKLLLHAVELNLSESEYAQTRSAARRQAELLLYTASLHGVGIYFELCAEVFRKVGIIPLLNMKNLLRALISSFQHAGIF